MMESRTLSIRDLREEEHFVTHGIRWLPQETYIGNVSYMVKGKPSESSTRMEGLIVDALKSMTFTVKELRRVRVYFNEQLEELKALANGARGHNLILHFYEMPDLSKSRFNGTITTHPKALRLCHWIPESDDRLQFLPRELLVSVPSDFDHWERELDRIDPMHSHVTA
jgi:hypothetical protein